MYYLYLCISLLFLFLLLLFLLHLNHTHKHGIFKCYISWFIGINVKRGSDLNSKVASPLCLPWSEWYWDPRYCSTQRKMNGGVHHQQEQHSTEQTNERGHERNTKRTELWLSKRTNDQPTKAQGTTNARNHPHHEGPSSSSSRIGGRTSSEREKREGGGDGKMGKRGLRKRSRSWRRQASRQGG